MCFFHQGKRQYRLKGGIPSNAEPDHPMSIENPPAYAEIDDIPKESELSPSTNGNLTKTSESSESQDQLPSLPKERKTSCLTDQPPPVPKTRRPSGAIETLAMGILHLGDEQHPRKVSIDHGRVNPYPQEQEKPPVVLARARRPSELSDPPTPLQEETTPIWTYPLGQRERVYANVHSEITEPSNHLPERDMPHTTILEERPYGNVRPTFAKIPVESHDEGANDITDDNVHLDFRNTGVAPVGEQPN